MHFDDGLSARYKAGDSTKLVTKGIRGKSASEKLSEEGLVKFSARVAIQVIFRCSLMKFNYRSILFFESRRQIMRIAIKILEVTPLVDRGIGLFA